jgi:hypothetical protein
MSRAMVPLVLVFVLNLVSVGNHAIAFTVRFGPVPVTEGLASPDETADADLPTPRMFNVTIGAAGVAFGPIAAQTCRCTGSFFGFISVLHRGLNPGFLV